MQLIDIGANLTHESFRHDFDDVLARAKDHDVTQLVVTGASADGSTHALALAQALFLFGANLALQFGAGRVAVNVTSVIMLSEVLFAALSSWLLAGEALTWPKLAGGGLIIVGALLSAVVD